jgi:lipopolysaccharide/colanic/teichoic acid biosynthesis glycosyltransferase
MKPLRREQLLFLAGDFTLLVFSLWLALAFRNLAIPSFSYFTHHFAIFLPIFAISLGVFYIAGLYEKQTRLVKRIMGTRILGAQAANVLIAAVLFFLFSLSIAPKTILAIYLFISVVLISAWRFYAVPRFSVVYRRKALLVGEGSAMHDVFEEVNGNNKYSLVFAEHLNTAALGAGELAARIAEGVKTGVKVVVLDTRDPLVRTELPSLYDDMISGVSFREFATFYEDLFDRVPLEHVDHAWLLGYLPRGQSTYDLAKRLFDIVLSLFGIVLASIFIIPAALLLMATGGHPFIFPERIGRGGKHIRLAKLRTMLFYDAGNPELQKKNRITGLGKFFRKTRIDELPQLWNVLIGDLSFIGPRPELPAIATTYEKEIPFYHIRHLITPGLSGWAQIRDYDAPRGGADVERTKRKLSYDLYYLKHRSFGLDLAIALKTIRALAAFSGV